VGWSGAIRWAAIESRPQCIGAAIRGVGPQRVRTPVSGVRHRHFGTHLNGALPRRTCARIGGSTGPRRTRVASTAPIVSRAGTPPVCARRCGLRPLRLFAGIRRSRASNAAARRRTAIAQITGKRRSHAVAGFARRTSSSNGISNLGTNGRRNLAFLEFTPRT
jgi:hypothetical protein